MKKNPEPEIVPRNITARLFCDDQSITPKNFIPVFHRWIREGAVDEVLVDVADYSHLQEGSAVLLITHDGIYSIDRDGGRSGLQYTLRQRRPGDLRAALQLVVSRLQRAAELLREAPELAGAVAFRPGEVEVRFADQLVAPNDQTSCDAVSAGVTDVLERWWGGKLRLVRVPWHRHLVISARANAT